MPMLRTLILALLLAVPAMAAPAGRYVGVFYGQVEEITLTADSFDSVVTGEGMPEGGFRQEAPVAAVTEPAEKAPGRFVLGPVEAAAEPYEVVFFGGVKPGQVRMYRDGKQYATLKDAQEAPFLPAGPGRIYFTRERYDELQALPTLPEPDKATLLAYLKEAMDRTPQGVGPSYQDEVMTTLMIEKGFNPFASRKPFIEGRKRWAGDPEVQALLQQFKAKAEGRQPTPTTSP